MGSQHLSIPRGILRQLCYPGGVRLPRIIDRTKPPEPTDDALYIYEAYKPVYVPQRPAQPARIIGPSKVETLPVIDYGNLSNEAYKFFIGSRVKSSTYFRCRGCGGIEDHIDRRMYHMRDCRDLMKAIEERVKRDKICVVCNTGTSHTKWLIPLCSEACITKWRFSSPDAWEAAKRLVIAQSPHLLRITCESIPPIS